MYTQVTNQESVYCRAAAAQAGIFESILKSCRKVAEVKGLSDDQLLSRFPLGRLGFKDDGSGKLRYLPNAFKQALMRPAHDWCMAVLGRIPMD